MADDRDEKFIKAKREFDRREVEIPVEIEVKGERYDGTVQDISEGGLRLQCDEDLPERGTIKVHMPLGSEDSDKMLHIDGIIRWNKKITECGIEIMGKQKDV